MPADRKAIFNQHELERYSRQMAIPSFGVEGQRKLKEARVAVIGAGGLGAPLLHYLTAAGVGTIGIFDFDFVDNSNLQRQVLFDEGDIGNKKAQSSCAKLKKINSQINVQVHDTRIDPANAVELLQHYDIVADGSDNFFTRYVVNDACLILDIPLVYGSIFQFEGQVSVFNYVDKAGNRGPDYRTLFPEMPKEGFIPNCAEAGVIGALPGIIGSIQALEVIKIITGKGKILSGTMLVFDALEMDFQKIHLPAVDSSSNIDKDQIKARLESLMIHIKENPGAECAIDNETVSELEPAELAKIIENEEHISLIDVRTEDEHATFNIGGKVLPLDSIINTEAKIPNQGKIIFYCSVGERSRKAAQFVQNTFGYKNMYSLKGGLINWRLFTENK